MTELIWRPPGHDCSWSPDVAVLRRVFPSSVVIEIGVPGGFRGDVLLRLRVLDLAVARQGPIIELIRCAQRPDDRRELLSAGERCLLLRVDRESLPVCRGLRIAFADLDNGRVARLVHVDAVLAGLHQRHGQIRSVHFEVVAIIQRTHADDDCARCHLHLRGVVVEIQKREAGGAAEPNGGRADIKLGARILIRPQLVPRRQGPVDVRG